MWLWWWSWSAFAAGSLGFEVSFPMFPCMDGWAACVVDARVVDPDLQVDSSGKVSPADARIAFWALEPTAMFSPFTGLSAYSPPTAPVAVAHPPPVAQDRPVSPPADRAKTPVDPGRKEVVAVVVPVPSVSPGGASDVKLPPPVVPAGGCADLRAFEARARVGQLGEVDTGCLSARFDVEGARADRVAISSLLMADAWARGDRTGWEKLVQRHLEVVDAEDPDVAYRYADHLARKGPSRAAEAIRWADVALAHGSVWTGDTYAKRTSSLYKVRAVAAQALWKQAIDGGTAGPAEVDAARARTRRAAKEWAGYLEQTGQDATTAWQLCEAAAGRDGGCRP